MALAVAATPEHVVVIDAKLKKRLLTRLRVWEELDQQLKVITAARAKETAEIELLREQAGEQKLGLDGFKVTRVDGQTVKTFDRVKAKAAGITDAQIEAAFVEKPRKAFTKITGPNFKDDGE